MRTKSIRGVEIVDQSGATVGSIEDIDLKKDGTYSVIVRGEVNADNAKAFEDRFGITGVGKDFFEIPQKYIGGIGDKIVLNTVFSELADLKIISESG